MSYQRRQAPKRHSRSGDVANDRRRTCRSRALIHDVVLGWERDGTIDEVPAFLEDVSIDGCCARSPVRPAPGRGDSIWFGLPGSAHAERIEGVLVDARKPFLRPCSVRIRFLTPLPYATFKYLVYGQSDDSGSRGEFLYYETDQFWR